MRAILTYHSIDESGSAISLPPAVFETHRRWLVSGRVRVLSVEEIVQHATPDEDAVAVTFDDGYRNTAPALERLCDDGIPVTLFVPTAFVGGTNGWCDDGRHRVPRLPLLDWDELGRLVGRGLTVGGHTRRHLALPSLGVSALDDELLAGREDLASKLGVAAALVAYPYGAVDATVAAHARRHFRHGLTTDFRPLADADDPWRLPRLDMVYFRDRGSLEAWGTGPFRRRVGLCRMRRWARARLASLVPAPAGRGREPSA